MAPIVSAQFSDLVMQRHDNPFHDLWLTEILNPTEFVNMFSPHIVKHAAELLERVTWLFAELRVAAKACCLIC